MSDSLLDIPALMRQARTAASQNKFKEAEAIYALIIQDSTMKEQLDVKARYAFCLEKNGKITKAIQYYQEVAEIYKGLGEVGAAKAMELKISILHSLFVKRKPKKVVIQKKAVVKERAKRKSAEELLEAKTQELTGFLALATNDLENYSGRPSFQETINQFNQYLALGTSDMVEHKIDSEETLDLVHLVEPDLQKYAGNNKTIELALTPLDDEGNIEDKPEEDSLTLDLTHLSKP